MYWLETDAVNTVERLKNPWVDANTFEIFTFSWILKLFKRGRIKELELNDLYAIPNDFSSSLLGSETEKRWIVEMANAKINNQDPSLLRVLYQMYGFKSLMYGLKIVFISVVVRMSQPMFIGKLLAYFNHDESNTVDLDNAYVYASGLVLSMLISTLITHNAMIELQQIGMKMRVACGSLIFKKALRLSRTSIDDIRIGQIVNLLSNDVNRFEKSSKLFNSIMVGPSITAVVTFFTWQIIGVSTIFGISALLMFIPVQLWLGNKVSEFRSKTASKTDDRIRLMNEIVLGLQVIKMYTWEKPFIKLVQCLRKTEIDQIKINTFIKLIMTSFSIFQTRFALFISILSYIYLGGHINTEKIFVVIAYYNLLVVPMTTLFPLSIGAIADMLVSIERIRNFLLYAEKDQSIVFTNHQKKEKHVCTGKETSTDYLENNITHDSDNSIKIEQPDDIGIDISNVSAKWLVNQFAKALNNINLIVKPGGVVAIVGPVGAGKSSLIQLILRELPISAGNVSVRGVVSYASQEPWLFNGSVRQNILFDSTMDRERYKKVIEVCALVSDLKEFPHGDKTLVGENGVSLSGGQKARINLARAVYKQADIYLLDDPLSAVDAKVGKQIFKKCIKNYLKEKACILVTHQTQYLESVDKIVLLENAKVVAEGNYREIQSSGLDFKKLLVSSDETTQTSDKQSCNIDKLEMGGSDIPTTLTRHSSIKSVSSSIDDYKLMDAQSEPTEVTETRTFGAVSRNVYFSYISAVGNRFKISFLVLTCILTQILCTGGDYWISYWVDLEDHVFRYVDEEFINNSTVLNNKGHDVLSWFPVFSSHTCIIVYSILIISMIIIVFIRTITYVSVFMGISMNLHNNMFNAITRATMYFINTNSTGRILNRFTFDIGNIDEVLQYPIVDLIDSTCALCGLIVIVGLTRINLLFPTIIVGVLFYYATEYYFSLSRSIQRLEGITRSSVLSHLNTSIKGLTTIRAFKTETIACDVFNKHLDLHSSAWILCFHSSQAFGFVLDIIILITISILIFSFLIIYNDACGGTVGLIITQAMSLAGALQWGIRQSAEVENQMTSVERVLEYSKISQEQSFESSPDQKPLHNWPNQGKIEFHNLCLRYSPDEPYVLKNINVEIQPMEKVGIVGRTGAGKSSLVTALFRLADYEGKIVIDGIDVHELGLHNLRSKLSIISQEPVLFSGTVRKNLDPFDEYPDYELWKTLQEVELKCLVEGLPCGLNTNMSDGGSNFSVGQRQLMCLARVLLRKNKIILLDEATANVDLQTDVLIQNTIRKKFRNYTVLTIAHRLNTVMDSDKILVMDSGTVAEFDHPYVLLQNKNGVLYNMVEEMGHVIANLLHDVASKSYKSMTHESPMHTENTVKKNH